ncbi:transmembrane channel-like protein [Papilio machaon]|uniref:transmembrane channel-like protein n=1 Tax=Papilio machaon TaxID=76193 RepID=UPI001E662CE4|nr:transmembrane channel-like protein [Papilio machaon]
MTSSGVNLFHIPSETPISNEVKFSPTAGEVSEDEDYSASLSAVLRQRRASVRRSRKGRSRRPSSPFLPDETRSRRRSSIFTTSSGDTAISIDEVPLVTQEQIFENIHLHKEVLGSVKQQPLGMRRKLKIVHQAKGYIKRHEGQLQERLAQSKSTRDIYARFNILIATKWQQLKREAANTSNLLIPWELRIKEIESHFGSVVASYFTFLRWLFWVNLVIGFILLVFVITPEYLTANPLQDGERKIIMEEERRNSTNLLTMWEFDGVLKYSPIFYGYYSNIERPEYRMPLAYFLTGLVVYIYSFVAILRKMAENSRMSKLSEKEDECIFSWKLFTGWDFMIGNAETAHNRIASVILGFKEALLEEAEKKKDPRNWRIISLRALVIICVIILLGLSAYVVVTVVTRSDDNSKPRSWLRENETTLVVTAISLTFPVFFDLLGLLEHNHPRKQLRLQLARIMLLNLLNLYSLIFALFSKIQGMSAELDSLQPSFNLNTSVMADSAIDINIASINGISGTCHEILTKETKKKLLKLCWETMFGQELVKLTVMDLVVGLLGTLFLDFFRALFVRYMNQFWCWDLEKKFPEYGDFKIAENILHLINNQGMVWMGMFFSPGLVILNVFKLMTLMYLRSWTVMTCNVPHAVVFRVSKSNNFYLALLLTMLFLCVLPVGYTIVWVKPSWHCGPFSEYKKIYHILTNNIYKLLPKSLNFALQYIASPAIVIPLLVLLILIIYYLTSLTNSLREANNDLKIQLRRERTEERRKMFQLADTRRRTGSSAVENTPFTRWKKALPALPLSKSIDSDDRKTSDETKEDSKNLKRGIFAKIVGLALDKKPEVEITSPSSYAVDGDNELYETLPKEILKTKDISVPKISDHKKKSNVEFKSNDSDITKYKSEQGCLKVKIDKLCERTEKKAVLEKLKEDKIIEEELTSLPSKTIIKESNTKNDGRKKSFDTKQTSESSTYSRQSDSISSVIPVITISTTESDEEQLQYPKVVGEQKKDRSHTNSNPKQELSKTNRSSSDLKSLRRQSSVDSINDSKTPKEKKTEDGYKYQYSL